MIPESIKKLAQKVRTEIYGRDVRESIAKSMEVSGESSNEANERSKDTDARQTDLENRFDDQIAGNTDIDEVIDARRPEGGESYPTLRKRLDDEHKEVTTQLAQKVEKTVKVFKPDMQGSFYLLTYPDFKFQVDKYKDMGFDGSVITIHIDGGENCEIREDMNKVIEVLDYAKEKGLKTNVCKFHAASSRVNLSSSTVQIAYVNRVIEVLDTLSDYGIEKVYVLNEFGDLFISQIDFCLRTINTIKNLGYEVGVQHNYNYGRFLNFIN